MLLVLICIDACASFLSPSIFDGCKRHAIIRFVFSVTAEKWLPILEVPVISVKAFLEKKRCEGYSLVGLEQTANSTPLDWFSFRNKTVRAKNIFG